MLPLLPAMLPRLPLLLPPLLPRTKLAAPSIQMICIEKINKKVDEKVLVKRKERAKTAIVAGVSRWRENRCRVGFWNKIGL